MIEINELFKEKKFPKWFSSHAIFKEVKSIKKVFPGIGLSNFEKEVDLENGNEAKSSAKKILHFIKNNLLNYINYNKRDKKKILLNKENIFLFKEVYNQAKNLNEILKSENGRISLKLFNDITPEGSKKPVFRKGESLFRVYNKLKAATEKEYTLFALEESAPFKEFSLENVPGKKYKIVFSSSGVDGAWDIATMSSRGIRSCQSWDTGEYRHCTIGSVLDPFVGIIYLTSGNKFNQYGSKMMRRSIVRFVVDIETKKPKIILDLMYPSYDSKIFTMFKKSIEEKIGDKFPIHYAPNLNAKTFDKIYLPLSDVRKKLKTTGKDGRKSNNLYDLEAIQSYQDSKIKDKESVSKDQMAIWFAKNSAKKERIFYKSILEALQKSIDDIKVANCPDAVKDFFTKMKGGNKAYNGRYVNIDHVKQQIANSIANEIFAKVDKNLFFNSDTYIRRVYYNYFNKKKETVKLIRAKTAREINGYLGLKTKDKIRAEQISTILNILLPKVDEIMKEKLKEVVNRRKFSGALPLP